MFLAVMAVAALLTAPQEPAAEEQPELLQTQNRDFSSLLNTASPVRSGPPGVPVRLQIATGLNLPWLSDPFAQSGIGTFVAPSPGLQISAAGHSWYIEGAGQLIRSNIRERSTWASVHRGTTVFGLYAGLGGEFRETRFRHDVFALDGGELATDRRMTVGMGAAELGRGGYNEKNFRLSLLAGWYENEYSGIVQLGAFNGAAPLALDRTVITGMRVSGDNIPVGRVWLRCSLQYLRLVGTHSAFVPTAQWSGTAGILVRIWTPYKRKGLFLGLEGRFNDADPPLVPDRTIGLHFLWRLK
jgi:hypothetical protein